MAKKFFNTLDFLNVTKSKNTRIIILKVFLGINSEFKSLFKKCHIAIYTLLVGFVFLFVTPRRNLSRIFKETDEIIQFSVPYCSSP